MKYLKQTNELLEKFLISPSYDDPFPMAVFGTLRQIPKRSYNAGRMYRDGIEPLAHRVGFLPNVCPSGIWLEPKENCSGPFEIYFYTPEDWSKMIGSVDALEGFFPGKQTGGYIRTLMKIRLLPKNYDLKVFNRGIGGELDLEIPPEDFSKYPIVPCWAYSNRVINKFAEESVIWNG